MNKIKYLTIFLFTIFWQLSLAQDTGDQPAIGPPAPPKSGDFLDGIAAVVNEGVVTTTELTRQISTIETRASQGQFQLPPADILKEQVLERLIVEEVQMQRAERLGIVVSDQMLNAAIAQVAGEAGVNFEDMPNLLAQDGILYSDYRSEMRKQLTMDQLRRIEVIRRIAVSQREIDQCLTELDDNVVVNSEYNLSHILISIDRKSVV